jgi:hypothetical protein
MKKLAAAALMLVALVVLAPSSTAHHSFAAEFDAKNCREFTGTLTKLDWQSPHPYFYMDVKDASGKMASWSFQTYAPITLRRAGKHRQGSVGPRMPGAEREAELRGCRDAQVPGWRPASGRPAPGLVASPN